MIVRFNLDSIADFEHRNFTALSGRTGLYFIFLDKLSIPYPFRNARLIYIGMSESRINSIGKRLKDHFSGESQNKGIYGYRNRWSLKFTYLDHEFLKHLFSNHTIENIETYFLESFAKIYGSYPICNNRRGSSGTSNLDALPDSIEIDWNFFKEKP